MLTFHTTTPVWRAMLLEAMTVTDEEEELELNALGEDDDEGTTTTSNTHNVFDVPEPMTNDVH